MIAGASRLAWIAALGALAGCRAIRAPPAAPRVVPLDGSLAPLKAEFDAHRGEPRFIALLSPS